MARLCHTPPPTGQLPYTCSSERELTPQLDLPRPRRPVILPHLRQRIAEIGVSRAIVRLGKLHPIENVVNLEAKLEFHSLPQRGQFGERHIPVVDSRPIPVVAILIGRNSPWNRRTHAIFKIECPGIEAGENSTTGVDLSG